MGRAVLYGRGGILQEVAQYFQKDISYFSRLHITLEYRVRVDPELADELSHLR